jgi:GNAT superfamily N-acetyltransferase
MNFKNVRRDAAHWGWIPTLLARGLDRCQRWLGFHLFRVNVRPLLPQPPEPNPPQDIAVCVLTMEQLLKASADPELDLDPDFIKTTLAQGDLVCGAYDGDRLVAYAWRTSVAAPYYAGLWIKPGHHYHYAYRHYVLPEYRGKRVHTAMLRLADQESVKRGCIAEIDVAPIANLASLGAALSLGRIPIGFAGYMSVFGRIYSFRTRRVKRFGLVIFKPQAGIPIGLVPERT